MSADVTELKCCPFCKCEDLFGYPRKGTVTCRGCKREFEVEEV